MNFGDIELPSLIVSVVANFALAIIVLRYAPKNQNRTFFILFVLSQVVWFIVNFFAVRSNPDQILNMARWTIVSAIPHPLLIFLFILTFLKKQNVVKKKQVFYYTLLALILIILARSPYLFTHIELKGSHHTPISGWGMAIFGAYSLIFITLSFLYLFNSWKKSTGINKRQWQFIGIGLLITLFLILSLNFLVAVIFDETEFVNFGHLYTLPFVIFTAYAMVKLHLLNLKTVAAEISVILLNLIIFIQLVSSDSIGQFIINFLVLIGTMVVGIYLIRGVTKEIEQRKQLQKLSTELYRTNQKLKEFDLLKTEFLSITSHQLRTPLSGIKGYLSMMADGDFGEFSEEQGNIITRVKAEVDRLVRMVQDFLNVSRIESGRLQINLLDFNIVNVAKTVIKELEPSATARKLELTLDAQTDNIPVKADPDKIKDVIMNLTDNAIKYTEKGKVWVEVECTQDKHIKVSVHDSGVGVDPTEIDKLFNKFQRAKGIAKVSPGGTGLGLFIAKKIIGAHDGEIWAESQGKGQGATFIFKIPSNC